MLVLVMHKLRTFFLFVSLKGTDNQKVVDKSEYKTRSIEFLK